MTDYGIGERIRIRREELGITQDELAQVLGYKSRSSINKIETNARNLTQSKIKSIADALSTTPSYIMGWDEPEPEEKENGYNIGTMLHDPIKMQIMNIVAEMSSEEAQALLTLLRK